MGARIRAPKAKKPPQYLSRPCPTCGAAWRVINGPWLAERRIRAGLSQHRLARLLHTSGPYLSDIETNRRTCPDAILAGYLALTDA